MVFRQYGTTALAAVLLAGISGGALAQDTTSGTTNGSPAVTTAPENDAMGTGTAGTTGATAPPAGDPATYQDATPGTDTMVNGMTSTQSATRSTVDDPLMTTETATPTAAPREDGGMDLGWLGLIGLAGLLGLRGRHDEHIRSDNMGRPTATR